jgi:hypothetical protein
MYVIQMTVIYPKESRSYTWYFKKKGLFIECSGLDEAAKFDMKIEAYQVMRSIGWRNTKTRTVKIVKI